MKAREKILKTAIYLSGVFCLYVWLAARSLPVMNSILKEKFIPEYWEFTRWGEMYYFSYIRHFQEKGLPAPSEKYRFSANHPTLEDADIIIFGDSFFDFSRQKTVPEQLAGSLNKKVYYDRFFYPLEALKRQNFTTPERKLLIYETVERDIPVRFSIPHESSYHIDYRTGIRKKIASVRDWIFMDGEEEKYNKMLKGSIFTTDAYSCISTVKFDMFKFISPVTPKYYLDDPERPWLFFHKTVNDEVTSFYYQHTDEEIETYCSNIADLAQKIREEYNLEFLFVAVPNKYTLYHGLLNDDQYNGLLPRVYRCLENKGVEVVNLYDPFMSSGSILYYGTDTHWNEKGVDIATELILEKINKEGKLKN